MRTLTKTGIRMLSAKYRSILIKCAIINASVFIGAFGAGSAMAVTPSAYTLAEVGETENYNYYNTVNGTKTYYQITPKIGTHYDISSGGTDFSIKSIKSGADSYHVTPQGDSADRVDDFNATIGSEGSPVVFHSIQYVQSIGDPGESGAIYNANNADGHNIYADFISDYTSSYGGAIRNGGVDSDTATINILSGDFVHNKSGFNHPLGYGGVGGAIANGTDGSNATINTIIGNFIGNEAINNGGGAIWNQKNIGTITGDFLANKASSGGAIANIDPTANITSIIGNFVSNSSINGGAIYNGGTIGNSDGTGGITGDFILNTATTNGGAINNQGTAAKITNILGNFSHNSANGAGGAIYNFNGGEISNIAGDFESNSATTNGGAISNFNGSSKIGNIAGNFKGNHADGASGYGGAIYNSGIIENITGDFENNYTASTTMGGGAIANTKTINISTSDINVNATDRISAISFKNNYITNSTGKGGAIWNGQGTVGLYAKGEYDSITFVGGEDDTTNNKYDIDGIYNQATLNINGDGAETYSGTVNLYNVSDAVTARGTTNIYGGTVNVAKDLTQKTVSIAENATLTTKGNVTTTSGITNANILNLLGGSKNTETGVITRAVINSTVSGDGTTNFGNGTDNAYIQLNGAINQAMMNIKEKADVETNANNIGAAVTNAGILNLIGGELVQNVTGNGSIVTKGDVTSNASNLGNTVTNTGNRLTLTGNTTTGILSKAITGTGTTVIDGIVTSSDTIAQDALTINGDMTLTASADKLDITTALTNNGTLVTDGNLNNLTTLTNNGTIQIATGKTLNVTNNYILGGTLDLNSQTLNMQEQGETPVYSTLTVNTLKGTGNLLIDANVNETNTNADKIAYTNADSAVINLTNINVREGFTTHTTDAKDNYLTVLNGSGATFNVGESGSTSTQFGDYLYTFEKGTTEGTLKVTEEFNGTISLADYITGTEKGRIIDTYSFANNETLSEAITTGSVSAEKNPYTIGMNGKNLTGSETNNGITISTGKTLTIDGNGGTISGFNTALINEGTLNLENVVFSGNATDVSNAGTLNLTGENTFGSKITGETGTVTNSGTLNVDAANLDVVLTNNNSLNLGAGTLGKAITGTGTITTTGDVSSNANYLGNAVTNDSNTLTLTGGALNKTVTGGNITIAGDVTSNASIASAIAINSTKSLSIDADNVDGAVTNAGTLNLGAGTLEQTITGTGTITTTGNVASNASNLGNVVTNTGHTLTLTGGQLEQTVTGGNVIIADDVTSGASIASAIAINTTKSLSISADNVDGEVANAGTLNLGTGTLAQNVAGAGTTNISGNVIVGANKNIINTVKIAENSSLELNAGLIDATKANITENSGTVIMNGGTLSSDVAGAYETKVGGDAVTTTTAYLNDNFTNKGTLNLTSDIDKDIKGNGTTVLSKEGTYVSVIGNRKIDGVLNSKDKTIDMQSPSSSVSYNTLSVGTLNLGQDISLMLDSNIVTQEIDKISADAVIGDGKINMLLDIPNRIDTVLTNPNITLNPIDAEEGEARTNLAKALRYDGHSITSPIFEYTTNYDENTGLVHIAKKTGTDGFNKYLYAPSVVANTTAAMTTQIATLAMDKMDDVVHVQGRSGGDTTKSSNAWVKVMGLNDNVEFKNFENIDSKALTVAAGYNTDKISCGDCGIVFGAYAGYIGGKQHYTANDIDQDGGYVGLSSALTLGDAFLTATVNGGLLKNKANNMYGSDRFNTLWLGTGLKAGYNYAITDSVVLQPNVYGGYTLVNTKDYTSVSGVKIATNNLNFFEVAPGLKLSAVIADGWTGSVQGKYAIVMDNGADITANDFALQNISTKNYIEYGIGIDKSVTDAFYLGAKINRHDGGRTGWNGSIEFRYKF